ncbi:Putative D-alanyl-D-alanine carboxypeptidase [Rubrobacter xylanophilus DSM 9941]|uniref:serine hydrolase domain-containing protein n=1 Tax=Rubrobacter xylanophilus TaxID=49319 RepID=UPI001F2FDDF5|nr:serine hydrolase domain-containing protein [Rubrobacter xylanophilus]QYJ16827.1 Putative D-alanyl-D-alanine carboxypeptidase [Rubrobacter xylanophilus DSM 9941]
MRRQNLLRLCLPGLVVLAVLLFAGFGASPAEAVKYQAPPPPKGPGPGKPGPGPSIEPELLKPERVKLEPHRTGPSTPVGPPGSPPKTLRYGTPREAGLLPEYIAQIGGNVEAGLEFYGEYQAYPGAVVLVARDGVIARHDAYGYALKYAGNEPLLPEEEWVPMQRDTIFDLASISKLFTSIAAMQLVERGKLDLDAPVASYIPKFAQSGKEGVTVQQLLTHTSGLPAWLPLYSRYDTPEERVQAVYAVEPEAPAGTQYRYSDLNMITLGELVELLSGQTLDAFVAQNITGPLGMRDTGYNPPSSKLDRIAATEYQPWTNRGMIRGSVHDENAWSLGGVAGHAGVFSTAHDLAILAQTILNGGSYGGSRILKPQSVQELLANYNREFPGNDHGLGFELYQHWYMDAMATPSTAGHTGYTGTSLVINPLDRSFAILLTNRVHPSRATVSTNPYRRAVARDVARAVAVRIPAPPHERAWFSGLGDGLNRPLDLPLNLPEGGKRLEFDLWYDTEPESDYGAVEISTDGGESWQPVSGTISGKGGFRETVEGRFTGWSGRAWHRARFDLTPYEGPAILRFRYTTDACCGGRGVYVHGVRVRNGGTTVFDEQRPEDRRLWRPDGWVLSRD